jgi:NAD(P)-dependent dehydrogenase (short-subunit alcohol dehydrogenase family)
MGQQETTMSSNSKTWFITGASRGFGRIWTEAALARGDRVAATARDPKTLAALQERYSDKVLALKLDVTDREAAHNAVQQAHAHFGRLDVVVNNAGYGLFGMVEEVSEQQARDQFETNFYGALWVTQAVLPLMRSRGSGHIVQISSIGGVMAWPNLGLYNASKWALEGLSQSLAAEVGSLGVKVTLIEPTGYATEWGGGSATFAQPVAAYDGVREYIAANWSNISVGEPQATAQALLALVDADEPPLRAFFGAGMLGLMQGEYAQRLETWSAWSHLSDSAMKS